MNSLWKNLKKMKKIDKKDVNTKLTAGMIE